MRQVVVFVRVNNMATLQTEHQVTFVVDVKPNLPAEEAVQVALDRALAEATSKAE